MNIFAIIENMNKKYMKNDNEGEMINNLNYIIKTGSIPIILSAPHAVKSTRNKKAKSQDIMTGGIVEYIADSTLCFAITRVCHIKDDPNASNIGQSLIYKQEILKLIKENNIVLLLDIHGSSNIHEFEIELGTNNGKNIGYDDSLIKILYKHLSNVGHVTIDTKFKASLHTTVSNYIHKLANIPCVQIEINTHIRTNPEKLEQLVNEISKAIYEIVELRIYNGKEGNV